MTGPTDPRLAQLAREVLADGLSSVLFEQLIERPPDPVEFRIAVGDLAPQASDQGRFGLAELALTLALRNLVFRGAAEAAIGDGAVRPHFLTSLCTTGGAATGDDLLWWYSVFTRGVRLDSAHDTLLHEHGPFLLEHRREAVLAYLLEPDRGPAGYLTDSFTRVLSVLGDCPPLQDRWTAWIRRGGFEIARPQSEPSRILAACLTTLFDDGVPAGRRLLAETTTRWRTLLDSGDVVDQRRVVRAVWSMLQNGPLNSGRVEVCDDVLTALLHDVAPAVERAGLPEATAVHLALTTARWVLRDRSPSADRYARSAESRLYDLMAAEEQRTPDLPWPAAKVFG